MVSSILSELKQRSVTCNAEFSKSIETTFWCRVMIKDKNIKICKDCKWYNRDFFDDDLSRCSNPKAHGYRIDPITGSIKYAYCDIERTPYMLPNCGPKANFFESKFIDVNCPKKSFWSRLFGA